LAAHTVRIAQVAWLSGLCVFPFLAAGSAAAAGQPALEHHDASQAYGLEHAGRGGRLLLNDTSGIVQIWSLQLS